MSSLAFNTASFYYFWAVELDNRTAAAVQSEWTHVRTLIFWLYDRIHCIQAVAFKDSQQCEWSVESVTILTSAGWVWYKSKVAWLTSVGDVAGLRKSYKLWSAGM